MTAAATAASPLLTVDRDAVRNEIGKDRCLHHYRQMLTIRRFEEKAEVCSNQFRTGTQIKKIAGFLHLYIGQEAVQTGFYAHLDPKRDSSVTSYRCHALGLLCGLHPRELMAELFGKVTGNVRGKGGSMHFFSKEKRMLGGHGIVGGQIPVGAGAAFAAKYQKTGGVSVSFLGDGATPQGTFHESLNMASLWDLPAIFVIENNKYGMGTACHRSNAVEHLAAAKAPGYGMHSITYDGLDLFASWKAAQQAVEWARRGEPVLCEAKTYRFRGHSASDAGLYRTKEELDEMKRQDPIERFKADLLACNWMTQLDVDRIEEEVVEVIADAVKFSEDSPEPPASELSRHVFAEV